MSQPAPGESRPRRPRKERGKRSKNGCQTCLDKRVKCDERHPVCHRCARLQLCCEWPGVRPSLAERRRGLGPIKDRHYWSPRSIQPRGIENSNIIETTQGENYPSNVACPSHPRSIDSGKETTENTIASNTFVQSSSPTINLDAFEMNAVSIQGGTLQPHTSSQSTAFPTYSSSRPYSLPEPSLSTNLFHTLPPSPIWTETDDILGHKDMQALTFHRTIFAPLKSTQDASRSAHSLFLHRAFDRQMALHFLLAVSHNELEIYKKRQFTPNQESRSHYRRGSELLQRQMEVRNIAPADHLNVMLSFLYIYLFWMRRDRLNPQKLCQLSRTIYNYLHRYSIDLVCGLGELLPPITNLPHLAMSVSDQILLARLLIYLYDRDGFCSFFGCGGTLANYVNTMPEKRQALWQISRIPFIWPMVEFSTIGQSFEETDHAHILDVYFDLIVLHQEINCLSQTQNMDEDTSVSEARLRERLRDLEHNVSFIRSIAEDNTEIDAPLMAYVTATVFYALRVYLNRATTHGFGSTPFHPETQRAQRALLTVAYKTVAAGPVQLLERFQWALLIAGMETSDAIHRDWVEDSISDPGIRGLLRMILREKSRLDGVICMSTVRRLVRYS